MSTFSYLRTITFASFCLVFLTPLGLSAAVSAVDLNYSSIQTDKTQLKADGIENATVTVTIKNENLLTLSGESVTLVSSRGAMDEIVNPTITTNSAGKARFIVRSLKNGTSEFRANVQGKTLPGIITITFSNGLSFGLEAGDLIKIPDDNNVKTLSDTAVYYFASNGKRYVFPNEKTYFTWYEDFSKVKTIPTDQMSLAPIGGNVTYRPGTRLVKFQTDPKTYITTRGGVLRWVTSETIARAWFGDQWNTFVDDISEGFYVNYTFGQPITTSVDVAPELLRTNTRTIERDKGIN